jgi:hypothetical protein
MADEPRKQQADRQRENQKPGDQQHKQDQKRDPQQGRQGNQGEKREAVRLGWGRQKLSASAYSIILFD